LPLGVWNCDRPRTAPMRRPSLGGLVAMVLTSFLVLVE
jgi:hypothetical protein